jgi:hypothetical protein
LKRKRKRRNLRYSVLKLQLKEHKINLIKHKTLLRNNKLRQNRSNCNLSRKLTKENKKFLISKKILNKTKKTLLKKKEKPKKLERKLQKIMLLLPREPTKLN